MAKETKQHLLIESAGLEVEVYRSEADDVLVIDIVGPDNQDDQDVNSAPRLRVYLNDGVLYDNPPYPQSVETMFNDGQRVEFTAADGHAVFGGIVQGTNNSGDHTLVRIDTMDNKPHNAGLVWIFKARLRAVEER